MKKIAEIILAVVIVALVYIIYDQISTPIRFDKERARREAVVIERLKDIRTAQRAYKAKYQHFTNNFDSLIHFVLNDSIEGQRKIVDEDDSVALARLQRAGRKNVESFYARAIDTIFSPKKLTPEQVREFRYIPGTGNRTEFILEAGDVVTESKVVVPVVECKAPYKLFLDTVAYRQEIINLIDEQENIYNRYPGLKFGSMTGANNEAGNWE